MPDKKAHPSPVLAAVLSFLLPGLGQILCHQDNKGIFLLGMSLLGHWLTGGLSSLLLCPAMSLDAFLTAREINKNASAGRWEFFPGIKLLNSIPPRFILIFIVLLIAAITVFRIRNFAFSYHPEVDLPHEMIGEFRKALDCASPLGLSSAPGR